MKNRVRLAVLVLVTAVGINMAQPTFSADPVGSSPAGPTGVVNLKAAGGVSPTPQGKSAPHKKKKLKHKSNQLVGKSRKA